jgi:hypothetical protein
MAFNLGDAVVHITGDDTALNKTLDGISSSIGQKMKKAAMVGGAAFTAMGAAITGSLGAAIKTTIDYGDETAKAANRVNLSAEAFQELKHAVEQSGGSMINLENGLRNMQKNLQNVKTKGTGPAADGLAQLGISINDLANLSPDQQFSLIADALSKLDDAALASTISMDIFGAKAGPMLTPLIKSGAEGISQLREEARSLGIVMSDETAAASEGLTDSLDELFKGFQGIKQTLIEGLIPTIAEFLNNTVNPFIQKVVEWIQNNQGLVNTIMAIVGGFGLLASVLGPILLILPGLATVIGALASPIGAIAALIVGVLVVAFFALKDILAKAIGWVREHWDTISAYFNAGWQLLKAILSVMGTTIEIVFKLIGAILSSFGVAVADAFGFAEMSTGDGVEGIIQWLTQLVEKAKVYVDKFNELLEKFSQWITDNWDEIVNGLASIQSVVNPFIMVARAIAGLVEVGIWAVNQLSPVVSFFENLIWVIENAMNAIGMGNAAAGNLGAGSLGGGGFGNGALGAGAGGGQNNFGNASAGNSSFNANGPNLPQNTTNQNNSNFNFNVSINGEGKSSKEIADEIYNTFAKKTRRAGGFA